MEKLLLPQLGLVLIFIVVVNASWGTPGSGQYHIQTDEGPERYFKYQTDNGQYRKEKRLQDGTVIGTDAWIDAFGYLRQKDYIADNKGYRILKSKTVFVGQNRPIDEAMKEAKKTPASAGILVSPSTSPPPTTPESIVRITPSPIAPNSIAKGYEYPKVQNIYIQPNADPPTALYLPVSNDPPVQQYLPPSNEPPTQQYLPPANEPPTQQYLPPKSDPPSANYLPTNTLEPPLSAYNPSTTPRPLYNIPSTTYHSITNNDISATTPIAVLHNSPAPIVVVNNPISSTAPNYIKTDHLPPIAVYSPGEAQRVIVDSYVNGENPAVIKPAISYDIANDLSYGIASTLAPVRVNTINNDLAPPKSYPSYNGIGSPISTTARPFVDTYPSNSAVSLNSNKFNAQSLYNRNNIESSHQYYQPNYSKRYNTNNVDENYNQQYGSYDGVSATHNGFRYFLPRQYHEEESSKNGDRKDGSYGYIDPFGIRRVVYYNAGPGGFNHRKNNRYVGFNATPYDPRPT